MDLGIPPFGIKILLESNPLKMQSLSSEIGRTYPGGGGARSSPRKITTHNQHSTNTTTIITIKSNKIKAFLQDPSVRSAARRGENKQNKQGHRQGGLRLLGAGPGDLQPHREGRPSNTLCGRYAQSPY